jgi:phosphatidylglycerol:prolipoprotein diacylglycerol transferase
MLDFIIWSVSPEIFDIGALTVRWYGLFFALGFFFGQIILVKIFKVEGRPEQDVDTLTVYMVIATIIGARLGHTMFYQPEIYLRNPIEILKIWEGGLASHGATIGIIAALYLYSNYNIKGNLGWPLLKIKKEKRQGQSFFWILDRIVIVVALAGGLIRLGNLMNSEIIGKPADTPISFLFAESAEAAILNDHVDYVEDVDITKTAGTDTIVDRAVMKPVNLQITFKRNTLTEEQINIFASKNLRETLRRYSEVPDHIRILSSNPATNVVRNPDNTLTASIAAYGVPRHAAQLYESLSTLALFFLLLFLWRRTKEHTPEGSLFGMFVVVLFTLRFLYEFLKENQVAFEDTIPLNMGQILSIPMVLAGIIVLIKTRKKKDKEQHLTR